MSKKANNAPSKKKFWITLVIVVFCIGVVIGAIHIISALTVDRRIQFLEVPVYSDKITEDLAGYQITFITDTHVMTEEQLDHIVTTLNAKGGSDIVVFGGDHSFEPMANMTMAGLSQIKTTDGKYGIEGNHDIVDILFPIYEKNGITPLSNSGVRLRENLYLAGVEDLWNRNPNVPMATADATEDDFVFLVTHNPDVTMQQDMSKVDYSVAGHTHGGQITFFGVWAPALTLRKTITAYGGRFQSGLCKTDQGDPVYVSRGTGNIPSAPRIFSRPQVITFVLKPAEEQ